MPRKRKDPFEKLMRTAYNATDYGQVAAEPAPVGDEPARCAKKWTEGMARHFREVLAKQLRELREEAGLSQAELARRAGISRQALNQIEASEGDPSFATVSRLASELKKCAED